MEKFIAAAKDGYVDLLREATKRDLNTPDEDGRTPTMWAAHNGNLEALRLIVGRQGDVDQCDYMGFTSLHHATMRGHFDVISYLVHWGCNIYALDNDHQTALDLAAMNNRTDIVKFLDTITAQRQGKNPKQATKQKEAARQAADANIKRYIRLQDVAKKRAEKEHRQIEKQTIKQDNGTLSKPRKSIFETISLRVKGKDSLHKNLRPQGSKYSDMAGLTYSGGKSGIARQVQQRRSEEIVSGSSNVLVTDGQRTMRSQTFDKGLSTGATVNGAEAQEDLSMNRRPMLPNVFGHSNMYKARSESDILDATDNDVDDSDEEGSSMFNRPGFAKISFLPKHGILNTFQSLDEAQTGSLDRKRRSGDGEEEVETYYDGFSELNQPMPFNPDDLDDEADEEEEDTELSPVESFVNAAGLANYLHIFSKEKIDMSVLMTMTNADFRELGLPFGPVKKLREAIDRRNSVLKTAPRMQISQL